MKRIRCQTYKQENSFVGFEKKTIMSDMSKQ